jgi:hypothetical protein
MHMEVRSGQPEMPAGEDTATLTISLEKVCFIIIKARKFDAKDEVTEPDPGSNPSDDNRRRGAHVAQSIPCRKTSRSVSLR